MVEEKFHLVPPPKKKKKNADSLLCSLSSDVAKIRPVVVNKRPHPHEYITNAVPGRGGGGFVTARADTLPQP